MGSAATSRQPRISGGQKDSYKNGFSRRAHHSGSWYSSCRDELDDVLTSFLQDAQRELKKTEKKSNSEVVSGVPRSVIAPHAGYSYSGKVAAYSYLAVQEAVSTGRIKTIVVLHPSHHVALDGCAISGKYLY